MGHLIHVIGLAFQPFDFTRILPKCCMLSGWRFVRRNQAMSELEKRSQASEWKPLLSYARVSGRSEKPEPFGPEPFSARSQSRPKAQQEARPAVSIVPPWVPVTEEKPGETQPSQSAPEVKPEQAVAEPAPRTGRKAFRHRFFARKRPAFRLRAHDHTSCKIVLAATLLGGIAAALHALFLPQPITATAELYIGPRLEKTKPAIDLKILTQSPERMILSDEVLNKVAAATGLARDAEFNAAMRQSGLAGLLQPGEKSGKPQDLVGSLRGHVDVRPATDGDHYRLDVTTRTGLKSVEIANAIGTILRHEVEAAQLQTKQMRLEAIAEKQAALLKEVEAAEKALADYRATHGIEGGKTENVLGVNEIALAKQQNVNADLRDRLQMLVGATAAAVVAGEVPDSALSDALIELRRRYGEARAQLNRLSTEHMPTDKVVIEAQAAVSSLGSAINAELVRLRSALQVELARAQEREQQLAAQIEQDKAQEQNRTADRVALQVLEDNAAQKRAAYRAFLQEAQQQTAALNAADIEVMMVEQASIAAGERTDQRLIIMLGGLFLGLLLGILLAILRIIARSRR